MRSIPLREFMLHGSTMLKDLPLTLTVRGEPVCSVLPMVSVQIEQVSTLKPEVSTEVSTHEEKPVTKPVNRNYCRFCGIQGATLRRYEYEDGSGEGEAFFCDPCWKKYEEARESHIATYTVCDGNVNPTMEFRGSFPKPVKKKKGA